MLARSAIFAVLVFAGALTLRALRPSPVAPTELAGHAMGGSWSVKFKSAPPRAAELESTVAALLKTLDEQMSNYKPESALSRFNAGFSTDWIAVPREMADVVQQARAVSEQTGGAFDVTVAPLVNVWGFGPVPAGLRAGRMPSDADIAVARERVDYRRLDVRLDPPAVRKSRPDVAIDPGAIAKGYAADAVARVLDQAGVDNYLITVGGELRARGSWRVGIEVPAPDTRRVLRQLTLADQALSTSGDYRNFFDLDGKHYSHEIDPRTGRPITSNLASVSVVHESSTYADAMATALMILGPDEGYVLADRLGIAALFVTREADHFEQRATGRWGR